MSENIKYGPNPEEVAVLAAYYKTHHKLPMKHVMCTVTGQMITMFGPNLHNRVKQYETIENLLSTFISRAGKTSQKTLNPVTKEKKSRKPEYTERDEVPYMEKDHPKEVYSMNDLATKPDVCKEFTTGSCFRPDFFLDNDKKCNDCMLLDNCCASVKQIKL